MTRAIPITLPSERHPPRAIRKGFVVHVTDGQTAHAVRAESAPEARRFAERFSWLVGVHPEWSLIEVLSASWNGHNTSARASSLRRFRTVWSADELASFERARSG